MNGKARLDYNTDEAGRGSAIEQGRLLAKGRLLEWRVAEEEGEWPPVQLAVEAAPVPASTWRRGWWLATTLALLVVLAVGGWLWHQARLGEAKIAADLHSAVERQMSQAQNGHRVARFYSGEPIPIEEYVSDAGEDSVDRGVLPPSILVQNDPFSGTLHTELLHFGEGWAIVRLTIPRGALTYRQTRLYRQDAGVWRQAAPSAVLWGAPRTLESSHFVFHYYALDAEAVAAAAAKLDALYPEIAADYRLDPAQTGKIGIDVSPEVPLRTPVEALPSEPLKYASPSLYLAPAQISEGDILAQAILLNLLPRLAEQSSAAALFTASQDTQAQTRVRAFLSALGLWQLWRAELPLAALHKPAIQWFYGDTPRGPRSLPAFNADLCPLHDLWRPAPYVIHLPLFCGKPQLFHNYSVDYFLNASPRTLAEIHINSQRMSDEPARGVSLTQAEHIGLATVIDYVAAVYGRPAIPRLIANTADTPGWKKLIPTTFGVPAPEFEQGWLAYLHDRYGVTTTP